jgi:uncharacterized protein
MAGVPIAIYPPLPPFTREGASKKVRLAEDGWNTRESDQVALTYAIASRWRNRSEFISITGRSGVGPMTNRDLRRPGPLTPRRRVPALLNL